MAPTSNFCGYWCYLCPSEPKLRSPLKSSGPLLAARQLRVFLSPCAGPRACGHPGASCFQLSSGPFPGTPSILRAIEKRKLRPLSIKVRSDVRRSPKIKSLVRAVMLILSLDCTAALNAWDRKKN